MDSSDPVPLSALQHHVYCPRQYALIHLEQSFDDNVYTQRGQAVHALVDEPGSEWHMGARLERALPLYSDKFGLIGKADVVEFHPDGRVVPVEYKQGRLRRSGLPGRLAQQADAVQLAAQALCLEEMLGVTIAEAAIFQHGSRRRRVVAVNAELRAQVTQTLAAIRVLHVHQRLPPPFNDERCTRCSLRDLCQPEALHVALRPSTAAP
ncbi:MAG: CRISPR-associated protein Cas4 [Burkholderiales bacterium]